MEGYLAGFTKIPNNIVDSLINISENKPVEQNKIPILRRFLQNTYPTKETEARVKAQASPLIQTVQAADGKTYQTGNFDTSSDQYLPYKNQNGNDAKLNLTSLDKIAKLPATNKYETAVKESAQYSKAATILDNAGLDAQQKQMALQKLGIDPVKAAYYQIANDDTNKKTMYVLDAVNKVPTEEAIRVLLENRKQVNGQMIASNAVLDNLVDEGIISANQAREIKKYELKDGKAVKMGKTSVKKPKKISIKAPKLNKIKVKKIKIKKLKVKKFKQVKLKAPKRLKLKKVKL